MQVQESAAETEQFLQRQHGQLTPWETTKLASRRIAKLFKRYVYMELRQMQWKPWLRKMAVFASLVCVVWVYSAWARGNLNALFIPYTPYDTNHQIHLQIAEAANVYFTDHPNEMCISSLELSVEQDRPYFHIIMRSNMHHSFDGRFYNLLNPEYVGTKTTDTKLSALRTQHERARSNQHKTATANDDNTATKTPDANAAQPHATMAPEGPGHVRDRSYLTRALQHAITILPTSVNEPDSIDTVAGNPDAFIATGNDKAILQGEIPWSSGLFPNQDVRTSSEWSLQSEEKTYCEYSKVNWVSRFVRWLWPGYTLHPHTPPKQIIYRKKKVHIRYLDLMTTQPFERTFLAEHAFCIQHYMDVWNKQWSC